MRRIVESPIGKTFSGVVLRVRGGGNKYQFRLRLRSTFDGIAYRHTFSAESGQWKSIRLLFDDFIPSFRGRRVPDAPPLNPANIRQIWFFIGDYQEGSFQIEIESILLF
jgi:monofunctional biosynthetic peptidoglycan transglycosylase